MGFSQAGRISNWSEAMSQRPKTTYVAEQNLGSSKTNIWQSKISWKIALSAFLTILVIQSAILIITFKQKEQILLNETIEIGRAIITPAINKDVEFLTSPITKEQAERIITSTVITGFTVYSADLKFLETYGSSVSTMMMDMNSLVKSYRSVDGSFYEAVYTSSNLKNPYVIVARLNTEHIAPNLLSYVQSSLAIMLLL